MVIHKQGRKLVEGYVAFGLYTKVKVPLCIHPKKLWEGKTYYTHRLWKYVTCKNCLKLKIEKENRN